MEEQRKAFRQLLLLVGSNPLPNYLSAIILRPSSIRLFYSPQTASIKDHLVKRLKERLGGVGLAETCIQDATNAAEVRAAFASIPEGAHLHYTGGTKTMAAHARMAFRDAGGTDEQASYLDERKDVLRFDDGYEMSLSEQNLQLTLDDVLALHAIERNSRAPRQTDGPTGEDAGSIAREVLKDPSLAGKLYGIHRDENRRRSFEKAKANTVILDELIPVVLSVRMIPETHWNKRAYENWLDFLGGGWMETWCSALVRQITDEDEVAVGLDCKLANGRHCEIDVALVRGHRLYVISCTTDTKTGLCKSKLFEVAMRARRLGGDLARSALVSLLHGGDAKGPYVDQLRNDVADIWDAPNTPRVFGLDELKEWAGIHGTPNTASLKDWLDS